MVPEEGVGQFDLNLSQGVSLRAWTHLLPLSVDLPQLYFPSISFDYLCFRRPIQVAYSPPPLLHGYGIAQSQCLKRVFLSWPANLGPPSHGLVQLLRGFSYWSARSRWRTAYPELWVHFARNWANVFDLLDLQVVPRKRMILCRCDCPDTVPPRLGFSHSPRGPPANLKRRQRSFLVVSELWLYLLECLQKTLRVLEGDSEFWREVSPRSSSDQPYRTPRSIGKPHRQNSKFFAETFPDFSQKCTEICKLLINMAWKTITVYFKMTSR